MRGTRKTEIGTTRELLPAPREQMVDVSLPYAQKQQMRTTIENGKRLHLGKGKIRSARARPSSSDKDRKVGFFARLVDLMTVGAAKPSLEAVFFFSLDTGGNSFHRHFQVLQQSQDTR